MSRIIHRSHAILSALFIAIANIQKLNPFQVSPREYTPR